MTTERTPTLAGYEPSSANALKPGPLDAGMVRLLTAGRSVLRVDNACSYLRRKGLPNGSLATVRSTDGQYIELAEIRERNGSGPHRFSYIGERSDDGWITAHPGGWGENPVPGRWIIVKFSDGDTGEYTSDRFLWGDQGEIDTIIAIRLVEEASPVGGGVREAEAIVRRWATWIIDASADMETEDHAAGKRTVRAERDTILQALAVMSPRDEE